MEHLHHFDLNQDPFQNEPDLRFFCMSGTHQSAQLRVERALRQGRGLVVLAGEGGTGKSLLARQMFEQLEEEMFETSLLVMIQGNTDALSVLRRFCAQLGLEDPPTDRPALLAALLDQLAIVREDGRHTILIIDDAHLLGPDAMAEVGGLLNLEYEDRRLVSLLLCGGPELDERVSSIPALGERVDVRARLEPLYEGEAATYLAHRIEVAGGDPEIFEPGAVKAIYSLGGGRPRRMNTLADNALFEAFLVGRKLVSEQDVCRAGADLSLQPLDPGFAPEAETVPVPVSARLEPLSPAVPEPPVAVPEPAPVAVVGALEELAPPALDESQAPGDAPDNGYAAAALLADLEIDSPVGDELPAPAAPRFAEEDELEFDAPIGLGLPAKAAPARVPDEAKVGAMTEVFRLALADDDLLSSSLELGDPSDDDDRDDPLSSLLELGDPSDDDDFDDLLSTSLELGDHPDSDDLSAELLDD